MTPIIDAKDFILSNTKPSGTPLLGARILLHLASEDLSLWQLGEDELEKLQLPTPFWAFAWAGGQAICHYIYDNPGIIKGKRVLDFACGCGMQAIAAAQAGAQSVHAIDIDPFAIAATQLNAELNSVEITTSIDNIVGQTAHDWDVILAGDVCYEGPMAMEITAWLQKLSHQGITVLLGDPGRVYMPKTGLTKVIAYGVQTSSSLEDTDVRNACVWKFGDTSPAV